MFQTKDKQISKLASLSEFYKNITMYPGEGGKRENLMLKAMAVQRKRASYGPHYDGMEDDIHASEEYSSNDYSDNDIHSSASGDSSVDEITTEESAGSYINQ